MTCIHDHLKIINQQDHHRSVGRITTIPVEKVHYLHSVVPYSGEPGLDKPLLFTWWSGHLLDCRVNPWLFFPPILPAKHLAQSKKPLQFPHVRKGEDEERMSFLKHSKRKAGSRGVEKHLGRGQSENRGAEKPLLWKKGAEDQWSYCSLHCREVFIWQFRFSDQLKPKHTMQNSKGMSTLQKNTRGSESMSLGQLAQACRAHAPALKVAFRCPPSGWDSGVWNLVNGGGSQSPVSSLKGSTYTAIFSPTVQVSPAHAS